MKTSPSEIQIFAFRHGQTDWNLLKRFQGHTDIALNPEGLAQAQALAPRLEGLNIELILSSDLQRALHTAQTVAEHLGVQVHADPRLREACFGEVEGLTREEVIQRYGEDCWIQWMSPVQADFCFPGGESRRDLLRRVHACFHEWSQISSKSPNIGLSTHGAVLKRLIQACQNPPAEDFWISNCEIHHLSYDSRSHLWKYCGKISDASETIQKLNSDS